MQTAWQRIWFAESTVQNTKEMLWKEQTRLQSSQTLHGWLQSDM